MERARRTLPDFTQVSRGRRGEPVTLYGDASPGVLRRLGSFDVTPEPATYEMSALLLAGETIRPDVARLFRSRGAHPINPLAEEDDGMPGVAFQWLEVEGPINDQWPPAGHRLLFDDLELAGKPMESDSTRSITLLLDGLNTPAIQMNGETTSSGYHNLSHHGKRPEKIAELQRIDRWHMQLFDELLTKMKQTKEANHRLLDRTMVLYGSNLGDPNMHSTVNLPVLFAGGGFRHGQHLTFDREKNYPLPNLFVSILQRLGIETDRFASSTGTMRGLEMT